MKNKKKTCKYPLLFKQTNIILVSTLCWLREVDKITTYYNYSNRKIIPLRKGYGTDADLSWMRDYVMMEWTPGVEITKSSYLSLNKCPKKSTLSTGKILLYLGLVHFWVRFFSNGQCTVGSWPTHPPLKWTKRREISEFSNDWNEQPLGRNPPTYPQTILRPPYPVNKAYQLPSIQCCFIAI